MTPQSRPSTTIGAPTLPRTPEPLGELRDRAVALARSCSIRAGRPVRRTIAVDVLALVAQPRADRQLAPRPARDGRRTVTSVAGLVAAQRDPVGAEQPLHLRGHRVEDRVGGAPSRDQRRHPPQRRLLVGEPLHLCLGIAALGHVASDGVHEPVLDVWRRRPVEHPDRAVLADVTVLERHRRLSLERWRPPPPPCCPGRPDGRGRCTGARGAPPPCSRESPRRPGSRA